MVGFNNNFQYLLNDNKNIFFILIFLWCFCRDFADSDPPKSATISGFVRDAKNGETLTGAVIYPKENPAIGITSNSYGYFSLTLPTGKYSLIVQFLGYKTKIIPLELRKM